MKAIHRLLLQRFNESIISCLLGCFFGLTIIQVILDIFNLEISYGEYSKMGFFLSSLGIYHYMEFMYKCEHHIHDLSWNDF